MLRQVCRRHLHFDYDEVRSYMIAAVCLAFILSFNDWGVESFNLTLGLWHWFLSIIIVLVSMLVHDIGFRFFALSKCYKFKFKIWWFGLITSLLIAFITNGAWKVFIAGGISLTLLRRERLGRFPYYQGLKHEAQIALAGPIASIAFAGLVKGISTLIPIDPYIANNLIFFNVLYAVYSLLPIPPLAGFRLFWYNRVMFAFFYGFAFSYMILAFFDIFSIVLPIIVGIICAFWWSKKLG